MLAAKLDVLQRHSTAKTVLKLHPTSRAPLEARARVARASAHLPLIDRLTLRDCLRRGQAKRASSTSSGGSAKAGHFSTPYRHPSVPQKCPAAVLCTFINGLTIAGHLSGTLQPL